MSYPSDEDGDEGKDIWMYFMEDGMGESYILHMLLLSIGNKDVHAFLDIEGEEDMVVW